MALGKSAATSRIVRSSLDEFWREMLCWTAPLPRGEPRITGLQHVREVLAAGHGAILWESSGFGRRTAAKQMLHSSGLSVHQVHGAGHVGCLFAPGESTTWMREKLVKPFFDRRLVFASVEQFFGLPGDKPDVARPLPLVSREFAT